MNRTEVLIRAAFEAEADRAVDSREVLAALDRPQRPRRTGVILAAAAVVVVVAAVAVAVPRFLHRALPAAPPPAVQTVLVAGLDTHGYADSVLLGHLDPDGNATAISLPRDSWVTVPGRGPSKLTAIYPTVRAAALAHGQPAPRADEAGARALTGAVARLTGIPVPHYLLVDEAGFGRIAAAVGGVPVCLKRASHDPVSGADFAVGAQTLTGSSALAFVRQRHGLLHGDLDRIARLQAFLHGAASKLTPGTLPIVATAVSNSVRRDAGWSLLGLARQLRPASVRFGTVPVADVDLRTPGGGSAIGLQPAQVQAFVRDFTGGGAPASGDNHPHGGVPCVN